MSSVGADDANFAFAVVEEPLKRHLGVEDDFRIQRWYSWARIAADNFLGNPFADADGVDIPKSADVVDAIQLALFEAVRAVRNQAPRTPGLLAVSTGAASETYGSASGGGAIATTAMTQYLYPFALSIERF